MRRYQTNATRNGILVSHSLFKKSCVCGTVDGNNTCCKWFEWIFGNKSLETSAILVRPFFCTFLPTLFMTWAIGKTRTIFTMQGKQWLSEGWLATVMGVWKNLSKLHNIVSQHRYYFNSKYFHSEDNNSSNNVTGTAIHWPSNRQAMVNITSITAGCT